MTNWERVEALLAAQALIGRCVRCGWTTEMRTLNRTARVTACPTCGARVTLERKA